MFHRPAAHRFRITRLIPARMAPPPFATIFSLLEAQARQRGAATAMESASDGSSVSYQTLFSRVDALRGQLKDHGVTHHGKRSRVAIVMPNGIEMSLALLAVTCAGVAVPFNPALQEYEFRSYFTATGISFLLVPHGYAGAARKVAADLGVEVLEMSAAGGLVGAGFTADPGGAPDPRDVALILLTSGSTGRSKVVPLTHRNLCTSAWDVVRSIPLDCHDRCLCMWEQYHIGGLVDLLLAPLASGGSIIAAGGFEVGRLFSCLGRFKPTWFQGVPTTLREACFYAKTQGLDPRGSSLRVMRSVAAALPESWMAEIETRFGVPVIQTFGMTEASPLITSTGMLASERKPGSTGKPCGPDVIIMDEQGNPLPALSHGQIAIRGPNVFHGYEGDDDANAASFRDGWFYTGDVGYVDADGFLFLCGRVKELINRGGEKILPYEIDEVLLAHPAVAQAAAFGIPHPTLGEDVGVAVVLKTGDVLSESQIRDTVARQLAAFKVPRKVVLLPDLPRCPVGKVRRQEVAEIARKMTEAIPYQAPRNALESILCQLWAAELDVPRVGIDDDYAQLGGDSLTSVRLIAATQSLLQIHLSDEIGDHLASVRRMAEYLALTGCPPHLLTAAAGGASLGSFTPQKIQAALDRIDAADTLSAFDPAAARQLMENCQSSHEFRLFRQRFLTRMTPRELLELVRHLSASARPKTLREIFRFRKLRWARHREVWCREITSELSGREESLRWQRHILGDHAWLFSENGMDEPTTGKTLIVAFGGFGNRLFMPIYRFLNHLNPRCDDVLLLSDCKRVHYQQGIPGLAGSFGELPAILEQFRHQRGYANVFAYGTSSGGLPAILVALQNQWAKAIAVGADHPADHDVLNSFLESLTRSPGYPTQVILAYAGKNTRDQRAAAEISRQIPAAHHLSDDRFSQHNLLEELHQRSELRPFFTRLFMTEAR